MSSDNGLTVIVLGNAMTGKTALIQELARKLSTIGAKVSILNENDGDLLDDKRGALIGKSVQIISVRTTD